MHKMKLIGGACAALLTLSMGCEKPKVEIEVDGKKMDVASVKVDGDGKKIEVEGKDGKVTISGDADVKVEGKDGTVNIKATGDKVEVNANDDEAEEEGEAAAK